MLRLARILLCFALAACACGATSLAVQKPAAEDAGSERRPPVAQVPTLVVGEIISVDVDGKTFTVMGRPLRRRPPGEVVIAVNSETEMIREQLLPMGEVKMGDVVKVRGFGRDASQPSIYAVGDVTALQPLTVSVSGTVKVIVQEGAAVGLVRVRELRLSDMHEAMEVQVQAWRGEEPLVAREVRCYEVLPGALEPPGPTAAHESEEAEHAAAGGEAQPSAETADE